MGPRIVIIGGGSYQWAPKLLIDIANTPSLHTAEIVLEDIDPEPLPRMVRLVERIAELRAIGLTGCGSPRCPLAALTRPLAAGRLITAQ